MVSNVYAVKAETLPDLLKQVGRADVLYDEERNTYLVLTPEKRGYISRDMFSHAECLTQKCTFFFPFTEKMQDYFQLGRRIIWRDGHKDTHLRKSDQMRQGKITELRVTEEYFEVTITEDV